MHKIDKYEKYLNIVLFLLIFQHVITSRKLHTHNLSK